VAYNAVNHSIYTGIFINKEICPIVLNGLYFQEATLLVVWLKNYFLVGQHAAKPNNFNYAEAVAKTKELIQKGENILYEAAFLYDGVYCALDILVKTNATWIAYEVKSSAKITSTHKLDAALQYYVISNNAIELQDFPIVVH
jgi:hypothetical protein